MNPPLEFEDQASILLEDDEIAKAGYDSDSDNNVPISSRSRIGISRSDDDQLNVQRIEEGSNEYEILGKSLAAGTRDLGKKVDIVRVYRKRYDWSVIDEARLAVFRVFAGAVACRNGGDPNVRYGWFGGSSDEIREIMMYGFRRFENRGLPAYGGGVYLSPVNCPMESVKRSIVDSDGLMHVLLCRVILGRPEVIDFGSHRVRPSSTRFDSGVNDISSPTTYVVWEHQMNTHILPSYAISFRINSLRGTSSLRIPKPQRTGISGLISRLTNYLSSSKMVVIKKLHYAYSKNKISRTTFIRSLRETAGDDVLRNIVRSLV